MNPTNSQQALSQLQQTQSKAQNPNQILEAQRGALGVNQAQETVGGLRGAINNTTKLLKQVAPSVMGRTQNSLVTQAQATRQIGNEQAPITQTLNEQGQQYSEALQDLAELQRKAQEATAGIYQGQQDKLSYLQNLYNTLFAREEAEKERQRQEAERQEAIRQFNEQMALQRQSEARQSRSSGGSSFNLTGANDTQQPASNEKKYIGSDDFRGRLAYLANTGNNDAKVALKYTGNDARYDGAVKDMAEYTALQRAGIKGNYYVPGLSFSGGGESGIIGNIAGLRF